MIGALLGLLVLQGESDPARLIDGLRSEKYEERLEAELKLKMLGRKAFPALQTAEKDVDPEVSQRARRLLRVIPVMEKLTPNLLKEIPGIEERLAGDDPHRWTEALLRAAKRDEKLRRKLPKLERTDLDALVAPAFKAMREEDLAELCGIVQEEALRSAIPELVNLIRRGDGFVLAHQALQTLDATEAIPDLVLLLQDKNERVRWTALWGLILLDAAKAAPDVQKLLGDEDPGVRRDAAEALGRFGAKEALADLRAALHDEDGDVRSAAAVALGCLGAKEVVPDLVKLLKDDYSTARGDAATALGRLKADETQPEILKLLRDEAQGVRNMALDALVEMEAKQSITDLRGFLGDEKLRSSVGKALVRLGSRDGVAALLDSAEQGDFWVLFSLNALRNPEVWAKLRKQGLRRDLRGKPKEVAEAWSKEAGFALEEIRGDEHQMVRSYRGRTTLWEALWELATQDTNCLVLESDRIRNLSPKEALTFWKAWWELERKK